MTYDEGRLDAQAILQQFDRSSPDALLKSIAAELARLHQANAALTARLHAVEALALLSDRIAAGQILEFGVDLPHRARIAADQTLRGGIGFHRLEQDAQGRPVRWTGPEPEFSFQLFVDRQRPTHFTLCFDHFYVNEPVERLRCLVDGEPAELSFERVDDSWRARGAAPARADRGGTVIAFIVPKVQSPQERGQSDPRPLGLFFRWLEVETESVAGA